MNILLETEIKHCCRVTTALHLIIELQKEIDEVYPSIEEDLVERKN